MGESRTWPLFALAQAQEYIPAISVAPFGAATYVAESAFDAESLLAFFGQVALLLPLAALGAWWIGMTSEERRSLIARFR